jgi:hypothetical protein
MKTLTVSQARSHLGELCRQAAEGKHVTIKLKDGQQVELRRVALSPQTVPYISAEVDALYADQDYVRQLNAIAKASE